MILSAREVAERYAGRTVMCKLTKSLPVADSAGNELNEFEARIVGWKKGSIFNGGDPSYVLVEVLPPAMTQMLLSKFNKDYTYTADRNLNGYGKRLLPEEIILPLDVGKISSAPRKAKEIPEWPDKCRDCGSPAFIVNFRIDCSNATCKHKFKTHSAIDLFLPVEMRPPGWDKDPNRKRRAGVDKDDFIVCDSCGKRAVEGVFTKDKLGSLKATCPEGHKWSSDLNIGDKLSGKDRVLIYKGKNIFIPYRV